MHANWSSKHKVQKVPSMGIQHIWVDSPLQQENFLRRLGKGMQSVKDDLLHWLDRINRTIPGGHVRTMTEPKMPVQCNSSGTSMQINTCKKVEAYWL